MVNNELYHYGVLGMKWGVRRTPKQISADSARIKNIRKKRVDEMSNQDLKDANNRLNLERNYRDLTRKKTIGKKVLEGMKTFTLTVATVAAAYKSAKVVKDATGKVLDKIGDLVVKDMHKRF